MADQTQEVPTRDSILTELAAFQSGKPPVEEKPAVKSEAVEEASEEEAPAEEEDTVDEESSEEEESEDEGDEEEESEEEVSEDSDEVEPEVAKKLAKVQKAEARSRAMIAQERADLERREAQFKEKFEAYGNFEKASKRVNYDPLGVLKQLGLHEDNYELAAQQLYSHSKAAAANPKSRDAAQRALREREAFDRAEKAESEVQKLRDELMQEKQQMTEQRRIEAYVDGLVSTVSKKAPLLSRLVAKNSDKARLQLAQKAYSMAQESGDTPTAAEVVAALEKDKLDEYIAMGGDVSKLKAAPKPVETNGKKVAAGKAKPVSKNGHDPNKKLSAEEERELLIKEMAEKKLGPSAS